MKRFTNNVWVRFCCYISAAMLILTPVVNASMMVDMPLHGIHGDKVSDKADHHNPGNVITETQHLHHVVAATSAASDQDITQQDSDTKHHTSICEIVCANCGNNMVQPSVDKTQVKLIEAWKISSCNKLSSIPGNTLLRPPRF